MHANYIVHELLQRNVVSLDSCGTVHDGSCFSPDFYNFQPLETYFVQQKMDTLPPLPYGKIHPAVRNSTARIVDIHLEDSKCPNCGTALPVITLTEEEKEHVRNELKGKSYAMTQYLEVKFSCVSFCFFCYLCVVLALVFHAGFL